MSEMIRAAIVRVRRESDQQVVGVGFLVEAGKKTILTCAHVINAAIEDSENQVKPRSLIRLDFPFLDPDKRLDARVTHFFPKKRDNTDDIALLEILDDLPAEANAVQLAVADTYSGHEFGVYGFPVGFEDNGQYVEGKLQEKLVNKRIQAVGTSNLGYFVERGFSGSPVYDKELDAVVGVMMQVDVEPEKRVAFISSPDVIAALYPELQYRQVRQSAKSAALPTSPPSNGKWLQRVDIFISSPSDVAEEREAILRVIERLNRLSYIRSRYVLNPLLYEKEVPPEAGDHAQMIVDRYMAVEDSYLLICLMWNRMGTPFTHPQTGEEFQSGTEYEFTIGYRANGKKGQPHLLLYRKTADNPDADTLQKEKVDEFFQRFEGDKASFQALYKQFTSLIEFENMLFKHIDRILYNKPPNTGNSDRHVDPENQTDIVEEARRLDAAMPRECQVGRTTEVRVMICLPASKGLKELLPDYTAEGDLIDKRDVQHGNLAVAFPVDNVTGKAKPIIATVELRSQDFSFSDPIQEVLISPNHDSGLLIFGAMPLVSTKRGRIHILIKSKTAEGYTVVLGSTSVYTSTTIYETKSITDASWTVYSVSLLATSEVAEMLHEMRGGGLPYSGSAKAKDLLHSLPESYTDQSVDELMNELQSLSVDEEHRRMMIGDRLAVIGDTRPGVGISDGIPDIEWLPVDVPEIPVAFKTNFYSFGPFVVRPFLISQYPITNSQFRSFLEAEDGFRNPMWWEGFPEVHQRQTLLHQHITDDNNPRHSVSWYQCVAFARWINNKLQGLELRHLHGVFRVGENAEIRLPTEWEWQWAAQGGSEERQYPWGKWQVGYANTSLSGLDRVIAVGMYPHGAATCGALDMSGNVWEWCQNQYDRPEEMQSNDSGAYRVIRGGSFLMNEQLARVNMRASELPKYARDDLGFRLILGVPTNYLDL